MLSCKPLIVAPLDIQHLGLSSALAQKVTWDSFVRVVPLGIATSQLMEDLLPGAFPAIATNTQRFATRKLDGVFANITQPETLAISAREDTMEMR